MSTEKERHFDASFGIFVQLDQALEEWRTLAARWYSDQQCSRQHGYTLVRFVRDYLHRLGCDPDPRAFFSQPLDHDQFGKALGFDQRTSRKAKEANDLLFDFFEWVVAYGDLTPATSDDANCSAPPANPLTRIARRRFRVETALDSRKRLKYDPTYASLLDIDPDLQPWQQLAADWHTQKSRGHTAWRALMAFFVDYVIGLKLDKRPEAFFLNTTSRPAVATILKLEKLTQGKALNDSLHDFFQWILQTHFSETVDDGRLLPRSGFSNPVPRMGKPTVFKSSDLQFRYVVATDARMDTWARLAGEWLASSKAARPARHSALNAFLTRYLPKQAHGFDPAVFLRRDVPKDSFMEVLKNYPVRKRKHPVGYGTVGYQITVNNHVHDFLDWVIEKKLVVHDGPPGVATLHPFENPVAYIRADGANSLKFSASPKQTLPYRYMQELRTMLAPGESFGDWKWAQEQFDADWFPVAPGLVNRADPDCVWRTRPADKDDGSALGATVTEMWSPVRAMALYCKLELPLRLFQVRFLDSGEADTWRYESGHFVPNRSKLARGTTLRVYQEGVFLRTPNEAGAALYINTNKTGRADAGVGNPGYPIPWSNERVLRWLEKLRNWQERYNPIAAPVPWAGLERIHFADVAPDSEVLQARGSACFLFRHAAAQGADRGKPIPDGIVYHMWTSLLRSLQSRVWERGERERDGSPIVFAYEDRQGSIFSLHGLRVGLITAYALDGGVPLPIISKLLAGHANLVMTLHYVRGGKSYATEVLEQMEARMLASLAELPPGFMMGKDWRALDKQFASLHADSFEALCNFSPAAAVRIEDKGICPASCMMCNIGGEEVDETMHIHLPVPGYPSERNCPSCRFFLSGPAFLPGLIAHFNQRSYEATDCAAQYRRFQCDVDRLEEQRATCEAFETPFSGAHELEQLYQRFEQQADRLNLLLGDLDACVRLIERSIDIANSKVGAADGIRLVTAGSMSDFKVTFDERSEMHQLEVLCENAVIFSGIDASKATLRRSQILDAMLEMNGKPPVLFRLTPEQQLQAGNEIMKLARSRVGSMEGAVEVAEGRRKLADIGLLDETMSIVGQPMRWRDAIEQPG
ncbi:conserved hypothetical protein [Paraburkholderia sabiae]|uniref:gamma-mobile-trio integrase GmtZ n=1 Tax=Paraburkholderia sabiae TaxID=273251 RepID=UPI001CB5D320|nr:VPA1269 family protein [Paraburkholderia sabiae]CAG9228566.1 conserved hypothetical protein [Paraburkholderia sabiae]